MAWEAVRRAYSMAVLEKPVRQHELSDCLVRPAQQAIHPGGHEPATTVETSPARLVQSRPMSRRLAARSGSSCAEDNKFNQQFAIALLRKAGHEGRSGAKRARGRQRGPARRLRCCADGCADAGSRRHPGDAADTRACPAPKCDYPDHRLDGSCHGGREGGVSRRRHERLRLEADRPELLLSKLADLEIKSCRPMRMMSPLLVRTLSLKALG